MPQYTEATIRYTVKLDLQAGALNLWNSRYNCLATWLTLMFAGNWSLGSHQISQSSEAQQEAERQSLLRNRNPQRSPSSAYCGFDRLSRIPNTYSFGDGVLRAGGSFIFHQEEGQVGRQSSIKGHGAEISNAACWRIKRSHCTTFLEATCQRYGVSTRPKFHPPRRQTPKSTSSSVATIHGKDQGSASGDERKY